MDNNPFVYVCATMWHEDQEEMSILIKSIMRLHYDQSSRKFLQDKFNIKDKYYCDFEAHIFVDDAYTSHANAGKKQQINKYVRNLIKIINAVSLGKDNEYNKEKTFIKKSTPYGGQLIWNLSSERKLIVHLKDSLKVKSNKRWSQVMYMHYLMEYQACKESEFTENEKLRKYNNTFLLQVDGDVSFEPRDLIQLIDILKKKVNVEVVCGRTHPYGLGPIVWYQEFEYALNHWMQKSAEHMLGCVICSPGSFSLFRGSALMDEKVLNTYSRMCTEAVHHVQFDLGEDRWLTNLLIQQGFQIEYHTASNNYTRVPESFEEFFHQRRRWFPSTIANTLNLLYSWKETSSKNPSFNIFSALHLFLTVTLYILSPATTLINLVLGIDVFIGNSNNYLSLLLINTLIIAVFVLLCFKATDNIQLKFAQILNGAYVLIQLVILVRILFQLYQGIACHVVVCWYLAMVASWLLAALFHPFEFACIFKSFIFYLYIPTMNITLVIYSICNMHVMSWGTRDVKPTYSNGFSKRNQPDHQDWTEQEILKKAENVLISSKEKIYFDNLIKRHLFPHSYDLNKTVKHLLQLRNQCSAVVLLSNLALLAVVFFLKFNSVHVNLPWLDYYLPSCTSSEINFVGFFANFMSTVLIFIQTVAMLVHRVNVFLHLNVSEFLSNKITNTRCNN